LTLKTSQRVPIGARVPFIMRFLSTRLGLALCLSVSAAPLGCSAGAAAKLSEVPGPAAIGTSLVFDDDSSLTLAPGATQPLYVTATPPAEYGVSFTLIGPAGDASLDHGLVFTGEDGHGLVTLDAPTEAATFVVHAVLLDDGAPTMTTADRAVAVSPQGFGSVSVVPLYTGKRQVTTWTASVVANRHCADIDAELPGEPPGAIAATAPAGSDPLVAGVPVGAHLAVTVRAGHFAWGCADTELLTAGSTLAVPVTVVDVALDFMDASLVLTFDYAPDPAAYAGLLDDTVSTLVDAFMPSGSDEGEVVLNGMQAATPASDLTAFLTDRADLDWDHLASTHFASLDHSLRTTCGTWATAGTAEQPTGFQASVTGGSLPGALSFTATQLGDLDAASAGVTTAPGATYSATAGDAVQFNATLLWEPSSFAGAASLLPAQQAQPNATSVAGALALVADCHDLAMDMGGFGQCAVACVESLCDQAIASRWTAALAVSKSATTPAEIAIQAAATATVGDLAQPLTLQGQWQGSLGDGVVVVPLKNGTLQPDPGPN
jgi:hypothetical protein